MRNIVSAGLLDIKGSPYRNREVTFSLVNKDGVAISVFDVGTKKNLSGLTTVTTDVNGAFTVNLWENDKGADLTFYLVTIDGMSSIIYLTTEDGSDVDFYDIVLGSREVNNKSTDLASWIESYLLPLVTSLGLVAVRDNLVQIDEVADNIPVLKRIDSSLQQDGTMNDLVTLINDWHNMSVATGAQGTDVIYDANLNLLTIPRGDTGPQGPQGPQGPVGDGTGDMLKSVYDINDNGIVDNAEKVNGKTVEENVPTGAKFTDTTYTVGDGGLTEINFTQADSDKLGSIEPNAKDDQTKAELDALEIDAGTVNGKTVETSVPANALFTDTVYTKPGSEPISYIIDLQTELDNRLKISLNLSDLDNVIAARTHLNVYSKGEVDGLTGSSAATEIAQPAILTPIEGATDFMSTIQSSAYIPMVTFNGSHLASDWEISDASDFSNIVDSSYGDTTQLVTYNFKQLDGGVQYWVRVRYISGKHQSMWSLGVSFTTAASGIYAPTLSQPTDYQEYKSVELDTSAYSTSGGGSHTATDWQVSLVSDFSTIEYESLNDDINLLSITVTAGLLPGRVFYARARHKSDSYNSPWSNTLTFNTALYKMDNLYVKDVLADNRSYIYVVTVDENLPVTGNVKVNVDFGSYNVVGNTVTWFVPTVTQNTVANISVWVEDTDARIISTTYTKQVLVKHYVFEADQLISLGYDDFTGSKNLRTLFNSVSQEELDTDWVSYSLGLNLKEIIIDNNNGDNTYNVSSTFGLTKDIETCVTFDGTTYDFDEISSIKDNGAMSSSLLLQEFSSDSTEDAFYPYYLRDGRFLLIIAGTPLQIKLYDEDGTFITSATSGYSSGPASSGMVLDVFTLANGDIGLTVVTNYNGHIADGYSILRVNISGDIITFSVANSYYANALIPHYCYGNCTQEGTIVALIHNKLKFIDANNNILIDTSFTTPTSASVNVFLNNIAGIITNEDGISFYSYNSEGTLITPKSSLTSDTAEYIHSFVLSDNSLFITYTNNGMGKFLICNSSGAVMQTPLSFTSSSIKYPRGVKLSDDSILIAYTVDSNSNFGTYTIIQRDGTVIVSEVTFSSFDITKIGVTNLYDDKVVLAYKDTSSNYDKLLSLKIDKPLLLELSKNVYTHIYKVPNFIYVSTDNKSMIYSNISKVEPISEYLFKYSTLYDINQALFSLFINNTYFGDINVVSENFTSDGILSEKPVKLSGNKLLDGFIVSFDNNTTLSIFKQTDNITYYSVTDDYDLFVKNGDILFNDDMKYFSHLKLSNNTVMFTYRNTVNNNYATMTVLDQTETPIVNGTVYKSGQTLNESLTELTNNNVVIVYTDVDNLARGAFIIVNNVGTIFVSEVIFNSQSTDNISVVALNNGNFLIAYRNVSSNNDGTFCIYDNTGTIVVSPTVFNTGDTTETECLLLANGNILIVFRDMGNTQYGSMIILDPSGNIVLPKANFSTDTGLSLIRPYSVEGNNTMIVYSDTNNYAAFTLIDIDGTVITNKINITDYAVSFLEVSQNSNGTNMILIGHTPINDQTSVIRFGYFKNDKNKIVFNTTKSVSEGINYFVATNMYRYKPNVIASAVSNPKDLDVVFQTEFEQGRVLKLGYRDSVDILPYVDVTLSKEV